jgi:Asp-tRNA(Asn)/Glu-tRNA(Gln) amidotransferase A subunit family amidase
MNSDSRPSTTVPSALAVAAAGLAVLGASACSPGGEAADAADLVVEATVPDLHEALRSGRLTCREVVQAYRDRIEAYDAPTGLNAVTVRNPRAPARADSLDEVRARGRGIGPLHCVPVLVKDNFDTHDLVTTGGSVALEGSVPPDDAFMVRRIREAGAVVVAKTNMAEWAFSPRQTVSSSFGTTANAYDLDHVPAGSSGGTASGVAASFGLVGLGTDTGNSVRGPASHLALFGLRSTLGLTSRDGVVPLFLDRDVAGPMTRTVADGARLFDVIAGADPADPYTELGEGRRAGDYTEFLDPDGLEGARVGVLRALADPSESDSSVLRLFDRAVAEMEAAGAEVVDPFTVPDLQEHLDADLVCPRFRYDVNRYLASLGPDAPIRDVATVLETGRHADYVEEFLEALVERPGDVPPSEWDPPCPEFRDHEGRQAYRDAVVAAMDSAGVDVVVYPTWTHPPARLDSARAGYEGDNSQLVSPDTGLPAATVPMGFSHGRFPAGLQVLARPFEEGTIFRIAYAYEQATGHRRPPEGYPPLGSGGR